RHHVGAGNQHEHVAQRGFFPRAQPAGLDIDDDHADEELAQALPADTVAQQQIEDRDRHAPQGLGIAIQKPGGDRRHPIHPCGQQPLPDVDFGVRRDDTDGQILQRRKVDQPEQHGREEKAEHRTARIVAWLVTLSIAMPARPFEIRGNLDSSYPDVFTSEALAALTALAPLDADRKATMKARTALRGARMRDRRRIAFLDPQSIIPRTQITVQDARDGKFIGSEIPNDLKRQWIQGTGPAARPGATVETGLRNIAYALLSGADGWMFDGEDALGQVSTMSLDNQRNLKLAIHRDPIFLKVAEQVAGEMNAWATGFFGRGIVADWRTQLDFTTKIFRARGLHLDDRHVRHAGGDSFSASIVDLALYVVNNYRQLRQSGSSIVLYLPKIQTAEEAALWNDMLAALERHLGLAVGTIKV